MINFLNSSAFSFACAALNCGFAVNSFYHGNYGWGLLGSFFAVICFYNFLKSV